jgi:HAD superfamily hydrolase (TIGR01549 family)
MKEKLEFTPSAVLWDFYNTLIVPPSSLSEALENVADEPLHIELGLDQNTLERLFFIIRDLVADSGRESPAQPAWQEVWGIALEQIGFVYDRETVEKLCRLQIGFVNARWRLQDFAVPLLKKLRLKGIPMAIVSNVTGPADLFEGFLSSRGIRGYFQWCIWSAELGIRKPHRKIFDAALRNLKLSPSEKIVMIGDDEIADIAGANDLGLTTVKIVSDSKKAEPSEADYRVTAQETLDLFSGILADL